MVNVRSLTAVAAVCALTLFVCAGAAQASTQTFSTGDSEFAAGFPNQGWWSWNLANEDVNSNWAVGSYEGSEFHNFFSFDLSSLSSPVTAATLKLQRYVVYAPDGVFDYGLFDVTTDAATLNHNVGPDGAIYDDLGTGTGLGGVAIDATTGTSEDIVSVPLNAAGIAAVNSAAGGFFSVGGAPVDETGASFAQGSSPLEYAFGFSGGVPNSLEITTTDTTPTCDGLAATITGDGVVTGTKNADVIVTGDGNDTVDGGAGNDVICTGEGDDSVNGGLGADRVYGQGGNDVIAASSGDDLLFGGDANDIVNGGGGNDIVNGDAGDDKINGGVGDDSVVGGAGSDKLAGNAGTDTCAGDDNGGPAQPGTDKVINNGQCETITEVP
jgi:Ca2+-binding RTX toxin-like protein